MSFAWEPGEELGDDLLEGPGFGAEEGEKDPGFVDSDHGDDGGWEGSKRVDDDDEEEGFRLRLGEFGSFD